MKTFATIIRLFAIVFLTLFAPQHALLADPHPTTQQSIALNTVLIGAIQKRNLEEVKSLLGKGASANATDTQGNSALADAVYTDNVEIASLLISAGGDVNVCGGFGNTSLLCHTIDKPAILALFLDHGADPNRQCPPVPGGDDKNLYPGVPPLFFAVGSIAESDESVQVELLLSHGAKVDLRDSAGSTALIDTLDMEIPKSNSLRYAKLLLDHGADVNAQNKEGNTPLSLAIFRGDVDIVRLLLEKGASANTTSGASEGNRSMLSLAILEAETRTVSERRNALTIIKLLLDHGAKPDKAAAEAMSRRTDDPDQADIGMLLKTGQMPPLHTLKRTLPPPPASLVSRARKVCVLPPLTDYSWLSSTKVILNKSKQHIGVQWVIHNIKTGYETRLPLSPGSRDAVASPDGQWLVAANQGEKSFGWDVCPVRGQKAQAFEIPFTALSDGKSLFGSEQSPLPWLPDSRHLAILTEGGDETHLQAFIFSRGSANDNRRVDITVPGGVDPFGLKLHPNVIIGITSSNTAIASSTITHSGAHQAVELFEFGLDKPTATARTYRIPLPAADQCSIIASPKCDRFAWILEPPQELNIDASEVHLGAVEFWVSDRAGGNWHPLGTVDPYACQFDDLSSLRWLPDGKRLSFTYNGALYIIPAQ